MKHNKIFPWILILVLIILPGCSPRPAAQQPSAQPVLPVTLTDGLARSVTIFLPAQRIVSLSPSNTELLYSVGAEDQLVGRDTFSNYPEEAGLITDIGGSMGQYDYEAIAALEPDLVLAAEINTPEQVRSLEELGLVVYYLANPLDFDGLYENILTVARLSGHDSLGAGLVDDLVRRVSDIQSRLEGVTERPIVFYELDATDPAQPYTIGKGTFGDYLINMAGGVNLGASIGEGWVQVAAEEILHRNPDLILLGDVYAGINPESVAARPGWAALDAVQNGKVIPFNDDLMSRPTARLVDGLESLANLFHPVLFIE